MAIFIFIFYDGDFDDHNIEMAFVAINSYFLIILYLADDSGGRSEVPEATWAVGLLRWEGQILAFVEKQESADLLLKDLMKASYPCLALHGGIDQYDRDSIIQVINLLQNLLV